MQEQTWAAALVLLGRYRPAAPSASEPCPDQEALCDLAPLGTCPDLHPRNCQCKCLHLLQRGYT